MKAQICSIAPREFKIKRSYNWSGLVLPACKPGMSYSSLWLDDATDYKIIHTTYKAEEAEKIPVNIPVSEIIADFFGTENLANEGCFVAAGETPTKAELDQARERRIAYLQTCVQEGDLEYSRSGKIDQIPGHFKRACEELGIERDWAFLAPPPMFDCPVCGEKLRQGVALCKSCGAILDREKAKQYGLVAEAGPEKRRGRPPKKETAESVAR